MGRCGVDWEKGTPLEWGVAKTWLLKKDEVEPRGETSPLQRFRLKMPDYFCQFVGKWLGTGKIWEPLGVFFQFLVEKVFKVVLLD